MSNASVKKPIKIFARLKPLSCEPSSYSVDEINGDDSNDDLLVLDLKDYTHREEYYLNSRAGDIYKFRYTKVFERDVSQQEVFNELCKPVLDSALTGYNGTVFAYGQTGSGKTFTMTGSRADYNDRGLIPRALSYVFHKVQESENETQLQGVYVSYLEIYNENGYDLLNTGFMSGKLEDLTKVALMEDGNAQIHLRNLSVHPVNNEDEALQLFYLGEHTRTVAETPMNEASTRSHCIFTIHLNIREAGGSVVRRSKVHLVDLAGSERIANSNISGQLLNEARHINLALHYLEQVIVALGESNRSHIPYRNSMMTSILRDSLGGNCMTSMIATISLEPKNMPETLSTCRFSQRVALVTNAATLNEEVDPDILIPQLKSEIKRLKEMVACSAVKPMSANESSLTSEELSECWGVVKGFLSDPDEDAILAIVPDMRVVQTCFRCMKMVCNMSKPKSAMKMMTYALPGTENLPQQQKVTELLKMLKQKDTEINTLTNMLRKEKDKTYERNFRAISGVDLTSRDEIKAIEPNRDDQDEDKAMVNEMASSNTEKFSHNTIFSSNSDSNSATDKETLLLDGLSDAKKVALDNFMSGYTGKRRLQDVRNELLHFRSECDKIEQAMNSSHVNLNQLRCVMMKPVESETEKERSIQMLSEAYESQTRALALQQKQLDNHKEQLKESEEHLKALYNKLMIDFEEWWNVNFKDNPNKSVCRQSSESSEKPLKEVATGIFKRSEKETKSVGLKSGVLKTKKSGSKNSSSSRRSTKDVDGETDDTDLDEVPRTKNINSPKIKSKKSTNRSTRTENEKNQGITSSPLQGNRQTTCLPHAPPTTAASRNIAGDSNDKVKDDQTSDEDDEEDLMKNLPMTGDPTTDKEILSFFQRRQAVFRKINEDKQACRRLQGKDACSEMSKT